MEWLHAPKEWKSETNSISFKAEGATDFWRVTHYDFVRDNGHFYFQEMEGDFKATVKVTGNYKELYDQAGLMVRLDGQNWIKTGVEYVDGVQNLSAVVTRYYSDWSVIPRADNPGAIDLRLIRKGDAVEIYYAVKDEPFQMLRLAYFPPDVKVQIGIMAAAPDGKGFGVRFENFLVEAIHG